MRLLLLALLLPCFAEAQTTKVRDPRQPLAHHLVVKTNLLNLVAGQPGLAAEYLLPKGLSVELAYAGGRLRNLLYTDDYRYSGFQVRGRKYLERLKPKEFVPFVGLYAGQLRRTVASEGQSFLLGLASTQPRNFTAQSIRFGGTGGGSFFLKKGWVLEALGSIGSGHYINYKSPLPNDRPRGYLDLQLWLSVGIRINAKTGS